MKLTSRATILVALIVATLLVPAVALGAFTTGTSNPGNTVVAGVLKAPGPLIATAHLQNSATNTGNVTLTWNDGLGNTGGLSPGGYLIERRPAGSTQWQPVSTLAYASACHADHTCTFTDATAAFNIAYSYRVSSTVSTWTAGPTNVRLAASVAPGAVEHRSMPTDALYSVAQSSSGLVAVGQNGRILVCAGTCTGTGSWQVAASPTTNDLYRVVFDTSTAGRVWAVGAGGTVLTCAGNCLSTSATWTSVNAGTGASLYGIAASSGYVAVVGTNRTMRYTTDAAFTTWQSGTVSAGTVTSTLYGIAVKSAKNVVIVGGRGSGTTGVIAACSFNGGGSSVCGGSTAFTPVTYAGGTSAPAGDMRDVGYVAGTASSDHVYAVGTAGSLYVSTSLTSGYAKKATGSAADLNSVAAVSQNAAGAVGEPNSPASSVFVRCTSACAGAGAWSAGADTGTTNSLSGLTGSGSGYWAVGSGGTIRYFNGTTWVAQATPVTSVSPALVQTHDGNSYAITTTTTLGAACTSPALVATATVPARSSSAVTSPTVKITVGYGFDGSTNSSQVSLSTNNGSTWSAASLPTNVAAPTAKTVDFTGTVPAGDSTQQILLCLQGSGGGGRMNVDMIHVDIEE